MTRACCALTALAHRRKRDSRNGRRWAQYQTLPPVRVTSLAANDINVLMIDSVLRPYADGGARITT